MLYHRPPHSQARLRQQNSPCPPHRIASGRRRNVSSYQEASRGRNNENHKSILGKPKRRAIHNETKGRKRFRNIKRYHARKKKGQKREVDGGQGREECEAEQQTGEGSGERETRGAGFDRIWARTVVGARSRGCRAQGRGTVTDKRGNGVHTSSWGSRGEAEEGGREREASSWNDLVLCCLGLVLSLCLIHQLI